MRILVTGAAGFIGSHAAERLLAEGHEVVGLDNFDPFYERTLKEANLQTLRPQARFVFTETDIRDSASVDHLLVHRGPFDAILHLAAKAGVRPSIGDPLAYEQVNLAGTVNLLQAVVRANRATRFVFASSSSVYGNNPKVPFSETDRVDHPISPYAATKKAGELICHAYHHIHGLPVFCLRFFTVYGPRQRPDLAISRFARLILQGKPIQVYGDGTSSRDYTYIDDIIAGTLSALECCRGYDIINLGSNRPVTLEETVATVAEACGRKPEVEHLPMQPGDVERTFADVEKAARLLDYNPRTLFSEGVRRQVKWLRSTCG